MTNMLYFGKQLLTFC